MSLIHNNCKQIFYINSNDRNNGTNEDFTFTLDFDTSQNYDRCCVLQMLIPMSYWLVRDG